MKNDENCVSHLEFFGRGLIIEKNITCEGNVE